MAVPFDWGEYVLWHLGPRVKVSIDGRRETVYSDEMYRQYRDFEQGTGVWDALLKTSKTDLVLAAERLRDCQLAQPGRRVGAALSRHFLSHLRARRVHEHRANHENRDPRSPGSWWRPLFPCSGPNARMRPLDRTSSNKRQRLLGTCGTES